MTFKATMTCANGHKQDLTYGEGFTREMVEDHLALMFGGKLHSLGIDMPGYGCAWEDGAPRCNAKVTYKVEPPAVPEKRADQMQTACGLAETIGGTPIGEHIEPKPNGQQKDYVVLTAEERAKGFVEPVRHSYKHLKCGSITTMGQALAETYARCPDFYSGTFCCACGSHFPVGKDGEFVWKDTDQKVGTRRVTEMPGKPEGGGG